MRPRRWPDRRAQGSRSALRCRGASCDGVQSPHYLASVTDEGGVIEDGVEVESDFGRVGGEQVSQRRVGVQRLLGEALDDPIGVVATVPALDECKQDTLREEGPVRQLEVLT